MSDLSNPLIEGLQPLVDRVRVDVTAVRRMGKPAAWTRNALTSEMLGAHLNGGPARGVCPIRAGQAVTMVGLLDFDSHKGETSWAEMSAVVGRVVVELRARGMHPILFRSSGGQGVHVYILWDLAQDCYSVRAMLSDVLVAVGMRNGTGGVVGAQAEVFPKQDHVDDGKFGSMFVLPLAANSVPLALEFEDDDDQLW